MEVLIKDLKFEYYRVSGVKVNKVGKGVRATHTPTGTVVNYSVTSSRRQNRLGAFKKIKETLSDD